jgi:hypothetical protein
VGERRAPVLSMVPLLGFLSLRDDCPNLSAFLRWESRLRSRVVVIGQVRAPRVESTYLDADISGAAISAMVGTVLHRTAARTGAGCRSGFFWGVGFFISASR